jgi:purine catabolism regulator
MTQNGYGAVGSTTPTITVGRCMQLPSLAGAVLRSSNSSLDKAIHWVSPIEAVGRDFVARGDLVLTTGVGADDRQLADFVHRAGEVDAAAVALSVGGQAPHRRTPENVLSAADEVGVTLFEIPWQTPFSDITRSVLGLIYPSGHAMPDVVHDDEDSTADVPRDLPAIFTHGLLNGNGGPAAVVSALNEMTDADVIALDGTGSVVAVSTTDLSTERRAGVVNDVLNALAHQSRPLSAFTLRSRPHLSTVVAPAIAEQKVIGWIVATGADEAMRAHRQLIKHAATALAIALHTQAPARARCNFVWDVATTVMARDELQARAALDGFCLDDRYSVCLGSVQVFSGPEGLECAREVAERIRRRFVHPRSVAVDRGAEVLLCAHSDDLSLEQLLADVRSSLPESQMLWGAADGYYALEDLNGGFAEARRTLQVSASTGAVGRIVRASDVELRSVLHSISQDSVSTRIVGDVLRPLAQVDAARGSHLVHTLEIFLNENGNVSSAARALHLSRHSLMHRLQRIEELTGRSLDSHEDRLLLDLSIYARTQLTPEMASARSKRH